jgi:hypothetical protein
VTCWSLSLCSVQSSLCLCHPEVFSAPYGHCHSAVFSAPYGHCHSAVLSAPYGHGHSAPYHHSAVVMTVPSPRTASRPNDAAASHSFHSNPVQYPPSYSECQLPLNCSRRYITGVAASAQNFRSHTAIFTGTSADRSTYI